MIIKFRGGFEFCSPITFEHMFWRKVDQEEWLSKIDINVDEYVMITISRNGYHIICGAHMNILFVITLIILVLTKWSYSSPPSPPNGVDHRA